MLRRVTFDTGSDDREGLDLSTSQSVEPAGAEAAAKGGPGASGSAANNDKASPKIFFKHRNACPYNAFLTHVDAGKLEQCYWVAFFLNHGQDVVKEIAPGTLVFLDTDGIKRPFRVYQMIEEAKRLNFQNEWFQDDDVKRYCKLERDQDMSVTAAKNTSLSTPPTGRTNSNFTIDPNPSSGAPSLSSVSVSDYTSTSTTSSTNVDRSRVVNVNGQTIILPMGADKKHPPLPAMSTLTDTELTPFVGRKQSDTVDNTESKMQGVSDLQTEDAMTFDSSQASYSNPKKRRAKQKKTESGRSSSESSGRSSRSSGRKSDRSVNDKSAEAFVSASKKRPASPDGTPAVSAQPKRVSTRNSPSKYKK